MEILEDPPLVGVRADADAAPSAPGTAENVGTNERWASVIAGGALALYGLRRRGVAGLALAVAGGALVRRGITGHCPVYQRAGINTAGAGPGRDARVTPAMSPGISPG